MKKLFIVAFAALGMLACTNQNAPITPPEIGEGFSVSQNKRVLFSQGNLQYQASTKTWRFAAHQYDTIGAANKNISTSYSGWIDLFGWGTGNNPTLTSKSASDYQTFTDWGVNPISNGGNKANQWRTLTSEEWLFLLHERTNAINLIGLGTVNGVNGAIILPDRWTTPSGLEFYPSKEKGLSWQIDHYYDYTLERNHFTDNTYTSTDWSKMEAAGAIFLPTAGRRYAGSNGKALVACVGEYGNYYTATLPEGTLPFSLFFSSNSLDPKEFGQPRSQAYSVRLVQDVE